MAAAWRAWTGASATGAWATGGVWTGAVWTAACTGAAWTGALCGRICGAGAPPPPVRPILAEQAGHAPQPWLAWTFSATAICWAREAFCGEPVPPNAAQVCGVNCRPPEKPLPVLVDQLPPLSHWARASQVEALVAVGVAAFAAVAESARVAAETAARVTPRRAAVLRVDFFIWDAPEATRARSVPGRCRATARP